MFRETVVWFIFEVLILRTERSQSLHKLLRVNSNTVIFDLQILLASFITLSQIDLNLKILL
jgi:hypothetical protein